MDWELAHAVQGCAGATRESAEVFFGTLEGVPLVLACCGMGMVSAAAGTERVIQRYQPRAVLNYGCAGAHRLELLLGDIVVGTRLVAYDNVRETPSGEVRYSGMPYLVEGKHRRIDALEADAELVEAARRVAADPVEAWPAELGWPEAVAHRAPRVVFGTVSSADRWNRAPATIVRLAELHESLCEDMEAAAIGLVCAMHGVPFLSIKDISNNELLRATSDGRAMLEELGADQLARRAAHFTLSVIRALLQGKA
jgi:adenosylhomocysteine nucleosidase